MDFASNRVSTRGVLPLDIDAARSGPRTRILLVDDDEATCKSLTPLLRLSGLDVEFVLTGTEALSSVRETQPDAIILDLHLAPDDIPGFVVLASLHAKYPELPMIAVTGWYLHDEYEAEARALGVTYYLFKPVTDSTIVSSLRELLVRRNEQYAGVKNPEAPVERPPIGTGTAEPVVDAPTMESSDSELVASENAFIAKRLPRLVRRMRRSFPLVWDDVIAEQVENTLLEFLAKIKGGTWPVRRSLDGHLRQSAWRNVRDHVQAAARRRANEERYAREQVQSRIGNHRAPS